MVTVSNLAVSQSTVVGPNIVPSDMVLYLDALSPASYPGSGTTWYDISGNSNNFTLVNSPTYIGNGFSFNGTNQYAECINNTFGNFGTGSFTLEYIFTLDSTQLPYAQVISKRISNVSIAAVNEPGFYYNPGGVFTVLDGIAAANDGNWYLGNPAPKVLTTHVTHTVQSNGVTATVTAYHKGLFNQSMTHTYLNGGNINNSQFARLMRGHSPINSTLGALYLVRAYSKALTPLEIYQNFDATRYRYSI
jgi:hypothetical protein